MSVVAVKIYVDKIVIGADSQQTTGQLKDNTTKLIKVNDKFYFGHAGLGSETMLFYAFSKTNVISEHNELTDIYDYLIKFTDYVKDKTTKYGLESDFIIVNNGKAFITSNTFYVKEIIDFAAIGSGREFAITALHLGKTVEEAIKVACDLTIYCAEPITLFEIQK